MNSLVPFFALAFAISAPALAAEPVSVPNFRSVELRYGGEVTIVPGAVQRVTILNGSTQFTTFRTRRDGQLQIDACNDRCPHNYNLRIQIESPTVPTVAVRAGGTITVAAGFAPQPNLVAAVSEGGTIDLRAVEANSAVAAVNAGGDILVRPRASLTAAVNNGGAIRYAGSPAVTTAIQGGGDVRPLR
jgi:hypothetical protein